MIDGIKQIEQLYNELLQDTQERLNESFDDTIQYALENGGVVEE